MDFYKFLPCNKKHIYMTIRSLFLLTISTLSVTTYGQTEAYTETGDTVYLYDNGTWSYELSVGEIDYFEDDDLFSYDLNLTEDETLHETPEAANKSVRNQDEMFVHKYDDSYWKRVPAGSLNEDAEFAFQGKDEDVWAVIISEPTSIEAEYLVKIALSTMEENLGSAVEMVTTENRTVNEHGLIHGVFKVKASGITFVFDSYYYSNELGSVQIVTWSSENVWKRQEKNLQDFLDGFEVLED